MSNFNTRGRVQGPPYVSAGKATAANPEITPTLAEISSLDALQMLLDLVGLIPALGAPADILNGLISAGRGDWLGAGLSFVGVVPVAGEAATIGKIIKKSDRYLQALKVVEQKVLPALPPSVRRRLEDALAQARKKLDDLTGGKSGTKETRPDPKPKPEKKRKQQDDGGTGKGKGKPKCGQSGPYSMKEGHDNQGFNWDHVPSQQALLRAARKLMGRELSPDEIKAIVKNAPTIAIPAQLHNDHSETFGGRQHQKIDGVARKDRDAADLQRAAKENTEKLYRNMDKYDKGCKKAYKKAAKKITAMTNEDWNKWLKKTIKEANR